MNYVRDRTAADAHVIATSLNTGSDGESVTHRFIGLKAYATLDDDVKYSTLQGATRDESRHEFSRVLKIGLGRYLLHSRLGARNVAMTYVPPREAEPALTAKDPWNFWVFSLGVNGFLNGESQSTSRRFGGNLSASRTTADWKYEFGASANTSHSTYQLSDTTEYVADTHGYSGSGLVARSVSDYLSLGGTLNGQSSSQQNIDFKARLAPTIEYDFFKYDQYTRRRLVAQYSVGYNDFRYSDTTIYNKKSETRIDQQLSLSYSATAPWGNASIGVGASNYLSDLSEYRASVSAGLSVRITRGLLASWNISYSRVHDQITLAKEGASEEERLLRLRQLATSYTYFGFFSVSYTFGSIFNNVVNPRMGGGGGGGGMMMMECC